MNLSRSSADSSALLFVCLLKQARHITLLISTPYYQDEVGIFSIDPVEMIAGSFPARQRRLVEAWAELHQSELRVDWQRLQEGRKPTPIEPLK